jgi:lipopolysaccharide/colanic/teichoic acid biosynthesis glycosyltransferase
MIKRFIDVFASLVGLVILSPLFILIAVSIKVSDGGTVFFRQERVGRRGCTFRIWKFRTMLVGADKIGPSITSAIDPRITKVGRLLRSSKLDELPQLINVVVGEMSLVGPRPEVPKYVALYTVEQRKVLDLKPGITDLASLEFRDEENLLAGAPDAEIFYRDYCIPRKIELNLKHASKASAWRDLEIVIRTIVSIVTRS